MEILSINITYSTVWQRGLKLGGLDLDPLSLRSIHLIFLLCLHHSQEAAFFYWRPWPRCWFFSRSRDSCVFPGQESTILYIEREILRMLIFKIILSTILSILKMILPCIY